jgi:hypothetical protein
MIVEKRTHFWLCPRLNQARKATMYVVANGDATPTLAVPKLSRVSPRPLWGFSAFSAF